jgi:hypothetical protein
MTVKLIKLIKKTSDQDWSGKHINTNSSLNSTQDSRDAGNFTEDERLVLKNNSKNNIRQANGYIGWDREYKDENILKMIYVFDTLENAEASFTPKDIEARKEFKLKIKDKISKNDIPKYTSFWYITDAEDTVLKILEEYINK